MPRQRAGSPAKPATAGAAAPTESTPRLLVVATVVVGIEAAVLAASALGLTLYQLLGHKPHDPLDAWLVVVFAALAGIAFAFVSRGLLRRRRWARSPAVLAQLLAIPIGISIVGNGVWWAGIPLLLCGAVGLVGLFAPSTTDALIKR